MEEADQFELFVRAGLGRYGVPVDETDIAIMRVVEQVYGPPRDALLAADLTRWSAEHGVDPSGPPREQDVDA
jgi:hypothetical protein